MVNSKVLLEKKKSTEESQQDKNKWNMHLEHTYSEHGSAIK